MRVHRVAAVLVVVSLVCAAAYPVYDPKDYDGKKWVSSKGDQVKHEYKYIGVRPWARPGTTYGSPKPEEVKPARKKKSGKRAHTGEHYAKSEEEPEVEIEVPEVKTKTPKHGHETGIPASPMAEHGSKVPVSPAYEVEPSIEPIPPVLPEPTEPPSVEPAAAMSEEEPEIYTYEMELEYPEEIPCAVAVESMVIPEILEEEAPGSIVGMLEYELEEEYDVKIKPGHVILPEEPVEVPAVAEPSAPAPFVEPSAPAPFVEPSAPASAPVVEPSAPAPAPVVEPSPLVVPVKSPRSRKHSPKPSPLHYHHPPKVSTVPSPVPPKAEVKKEKTHRKKKKITVSPAPKPVEEPKEVEVAPPMKKKAKKPEPCCCECAKKQPPGCYCYPVLPKRHFPSYYRPVYSPYSRPGAVYEKPPVEPQPHKPSKPSRAKKKIEPEPLMSVAPPKHKKKSPVPSPLTSVEPPKHKKSPVPSPLTSVEPPKHKKSPVPSPLSVTHEPVLPHGKRKETRKYEVEKKKTRHHAQVEVPEPKQIEIPSPARIEIPSYHFPQERYKAGYPHHYYGPATRAKLHCGPDEYCKHGAKKEAKKKAYYPYGAEKKHKPEPSPLVTHSTEETSVVEKHHVLSEKTETHTTEETKTSKKCRRCKKKCKGCEPCVEDENGCAVKLSTDAVLDQL